LTAVKDLNVTLHPQEYIEVFFDSICQSIKETEESWTTFNGDPTLEPEIKEFLIFLSKDPPCTDETSYDIPGMTEGDMQSGLNEEVNQEHHDYIEHWF